jgi:hypothetical protein
MMYLLHLLRHCLFVRPGTSTAIATQSFSSCVFTESFSLATSSCVHIPLRLLARPMLGFKTLCHLLLHCVFHSIWNQSGKCGPILATGSLYRILQLAVFDCCSFTLASTRSVDDGIQGVMSSVKALFSRLIRNQRGNRNPLLATVPLYRFLFN